MVFSDFDLSSDFAAPGRCFISYMQGPGKRAFFVDRRNIVHVLLVAESHVAGDCAAFVVRQMQKFLDASHRFGAVEAIRVRVIELVERDLFPLASAFVFHVAGADLVHIALAQVVAQGTQSDAVFAQVQPQLSLMNFSDS